MGKYENLHYWPAAGGQTVLFKTLTKAKLEDKSYSNLCAETIRWDALIESGSEAAARAKGILCLEGKEYIAQDGDVMHIRHAGKR